MAMLNASGYTKIAEVLKEALADDRVGSDGEWDAVELVAIRLADLFEKNSNNFDRARFYNTVGISIPMEEDQNGKRVGG